MFNPLSLFRHALFGRLILPVLVVFLSLSSAYAACSSPAGNEGDIQYSSLQHTMVYCNGTSWIGMGVNGAVNFGTLTSGDLCLATGSTGIACTTAALNLATQVTGTLPAADLPGLTAGNLWVGNSSGVAAAVALSGDCTISNAGAISCTKSNGTAFGALATMIPIGTASVSTYLRGDGSWSAIGLPSLASANIWVGNSSGVASAVAPSGDCAISNAGAITCTKTNGTAFGSLATLAPTGTANSSTYLRGDGSWATIATGSGIVTSSTAGQVAYYGSTGSTVIGTSSLNISGGNIGVGTATPSQPLTVNGNLDVMGTNAYLIEIANATTTGTTVNLLAKLNTSGQAVKPLITDTDGMVGIVVGGAGTSGNAQIATGGQALCTFDGTTVKGDFVTISSTTAGYCSDSGTSRSAIAQTIGRVMTVNTGSGTTAAILVSLSPAAGSTSASSFSFINQTNDPISSTVTSNAVTLSGGFTNLTASCQAGCTDIIHNGTDCNSTSCNGFNSGDTIAIKQTTSSSYSSSTTASVAVGGTISSTWQVTTTPTVNAFSFTNQTGAAVSTTITSNAVTLSGGFTNLTATCGTGCTGISRNGGSFSTGPVTGFNSGDTIAIKQVSSSTANTSSNATVIIGGVSSSWAVTTGGITVTNIGTSTGSGNSGSTSISLTNSVPSGSLIVVGGMIAANSGSIGTLTVTDSAGNTYTGFNQPIYGTVAGQTAQAVIFYAYNTNALPSGGTITLNNTISSGLDFMSSTAFYATNVLTTNPLDTSVTVSANASSGNPSLTSGTPSQAGELFVAFVAAGEYYAFGSYTADTSHGWVAPPSLFVTDGGFAELAGGTLINSGTGTKTFSPTGINDPYAAWILGFE